MADAEQRSPLCAAAASASTPCVSSLFFHRGDPKRMLEPQPRARRCTTDGCFAHSRCGQHKRPRQSCKHCAMQQSCRNLSRFDIERDQAAISRRLRLPKVPAESCAVVGSSAALLTRSLGAEIDAHAMVIRVNTAPTAGFERHVGHRTDVRVWGAPMPPRALNELAAKVPRDPLRKNPMKPYFNLIGSKEIVLRYCGPNPWFSSCWKNISADSDPRLHPSAFRLASAMIHVNRTRCSALGCVPTTGAMAILFSLEQCRRITVFGFGLDGDGGVARRPQQCGSASLCWKGAQCEKYYECARQTLFGDSEAVPDLELGQPRPRMRSLSHEYFSLAARWHDMGQEWEWLHRLHRQGLIRWRGAPDPRAPSSDPCHRRRPGCWKDARI
jgi:hypothetical protein